jgi:DNA-binding transcriptional LysR family regulator
LKISVSFKTESPCFSPWKYPNSALPALFDTAAHDYVLNQYFLSGSATFSSIVSGELLRVQGRIVNSFLAPKETTVPPPSFSASFMSRIDMAGEGRGITWARSLIQRELRSGRRMRAGGEEWDIAISICLIRSRARLTNAAESFWSTIKKPKGMKK